MIKTLPYYFLLLLVIYCTDLPAQKTVIATTVEKSFLDPPASARPWVFWYWMQAAVSKEGITADLEAMKGAGIGGAYLMSIKDTTSPPLMIPTSRQLSPEWWSHVKFAMQEAKRLDLKLAMHVSDGFALAGGPWITPELSMQKLTWTKSYITGNRQIDEVLPLPASNANFYRDIKVVAYPANSVNAFRKVSLRPDVTTSNGTRADYLADENGKESFRSDTSCWIQYSYPEKFTCRSVRIHVGGNNYQAQRLTFQSSDDGIRFTTVKKFEAPRHGWQDTDEDVTNAIPPTTARFFRFVYDKTGAEPGAEDLDAAKWKPNFKVNGIYLSDEPVIHQYESKNGSIWRISPRTGTEQVPAQDAVPLKNIIDLTGNLDTGGRLRWMAPPGNWIIVRIGHTSTGHTNATGGAAKGLECDKFNPFAIQLQFDNWFGKMFEKTDPRIAREVVKLFHIDSWECGSQNWSSNFPTEFKVRRGYDLYPYLLAMTGIPVEDARTSENVLHDVRQTIAELVNDIFYVTLRKLAKDKGCMVSAESVAPTMMSDGMLHYKNTDLPMGEFWLNSPTHDKPNDMLDAISGAHVYGKNIIGAESFTSVRMNWAEHPGLLKVAGDRNFALGVNKLVLHVFTHNPWLNRKPGMTLDGVGLYFQRDQTWFKPGRAWIDYLTRCQSILQRGNPVVDIAVFTGEGLPRRSVLPDRLVTTLPGIVGKSRVAEEQKRLMNEGQPLRSIPDGVSHSANMADPEDWVDPLNGYAYDSFNPDALLHLASVKNGKLVLPGGASYSLLVIPGRHAMQPDLADLSPASAKKIVQLVKEGATVLMSEEYFSEATRKMLNDSTTSILSSLLKNKYRGRLITTPYFDSTFTRLGLERDVEIKGNRNTIAWNHRRDGNTDIYFIANQKNQLQDIEISLRVKDKIVEMWDPVTAQMSSAPAKMINGRTQISLQLHAGQSVFLILRNPSGTPRKSVARATVTTDVINLDSNWTVQFDRNFGYTGTQPVNFPTLQTWTTNADSSIAYYSGTAVYARNFSWRNQMQGRKAILSIDSLYNIAAIKINGMDAGVIWTQPFQLDITTFVKPGINRIEIAVSNTWANRLIRDQQLPMNERVTWTTAPFRLSGKQLLPAGLVGSVSIDIK